MCRSGSSVPRITILVTVVVIGKYRPYQGLVQVQWSQRDCKPMEDDTIQFLSDLICVLWVPNILLKVLGLFNWMTWTSPSNVTLALIAGSWVQPLTLEHCDIP